MSTVRYFNPTMRRKILAGLIPWWVEQHPRRGYIVAANLSTPDWVDRATLKALHVEARCISKYTGVEHVLDHIVPLNHPYVCGLTVPWNLRISDPKTERSEIEQMEPRPTGPLIRWT